MESNDTHKLDNELLNFGIAEICLNLVSLNVCGLKSKTIIPEFRNYIDKFDIIGLQETKMDFVDERQYFEGYMSYYKSRRKVSRVKSGGLALLVKKTLINM